LDYETGRGLGGVKNESNGEGDRLKEEGAGKGKAAYRNN